MDMQTLHKDFELLMPNFIINGIQLSSGEHLKVLVAGRLSLEAKLDEYFILTDTVEELVRNVRLRLIELLGGYYEYHTTSAQRIDRLREKLGKEL